VQGLNSSETLDTFFKWDQQGLTREEVSPGPGVVKGSNRKTIRQCVSGEGGNQAMLCRQLRRDGRESREACLDRGGRQMHAQVRGGVRPLKDSGVGPVWTSVDQRDGRRKHHSHRFMNPFSDLAGDKSGAGRRD